MRPALFAPTVLLALTTPLLAQAQDLVPGDLVPLDANPAPVLSTQFGSSYSWQGFYVGGSLGYANSDPDSGFGEEDDFIGGFRLGYDQDLGSYVIGARIDYDISEIDVGNVGEIDGIFRIGGRLGVDRGRSLFYGIGGFADTVTDGFSSGDGFFVGGGFEVFLTDRITGGVEVLYHELDDFGGGTDVDVTTATVGINFRF